MAKEALQRKYVSITPPAAIVDDAAYTTAYVDTIGYNHCTIVVYLGATDIAMAALKVQECETSGGSYADISGLDYTGAYPSATDDNEIWTFEIDLNGRMRYLDLVATAGDGTSGTFMAAIAILSEPDTAPSTAALQGLGSRLTA